MFWLSYWTYSGYHAGYVVIVQGIEWLLCKEYGGYHTRICIGFCTERYCELWIVVNVWLIVVQLKLRKEHSRKQTSDRLFPA